MLKIKRAYEKVEPGDGKRILVDRLWPRGIKKAEAEIDEWAKELGPSTELRKLFSHDPKKWPEFQKRYTEELSEQHKAELLDDIALSAQTAHVTLIYGAKDKAHNNAIVLEGILNKRMKQFKRRI
ncbi:MAG: DUF488 domain-containing protein [Fibrobacter sp.]|nr:DUF488 domain-containing protein [Fibrobacter sp.]